MSRDPEGNKVTLQITLKDTEVSALLDMTSKYDLSLDEIFELAIVSLYAYFEREAEDQRRVAAQAELERRAQWLVKAEAERAGTA